MAKQSSIKSHYLRAALTPVRISQLSQSQLILETEDGWAIGLGRLQAVESHGGSNAEEAETLCEQGTEEWQVEVLGLCYLRQVNWSETTQAEEEGWY
jgi:hypothetical protein